MILFDSGATKSIISASFVKDSKYLSSLKPEKVSPVRFKLGNGQFLIANRGLQFDISVQGHKFKIFAYIAENLTGIDLILGTQTLSELKGTLDFHQNTFRIRAEKVLLKPTATVVVKPGETKYVVLKGNIPKFLKNSEVIIHSNTHLAKLCPTDMLVKLRRGRTAISVTNISEI